MQVLKEEVYEAIEVAAQEVFVKNGYEATSLSTIAKKSGISKSNMYNYYDSKEALFEKLVFSALNEVSATTGFFQTTIFEINQLEDLKSALVEKIPALYKERDGILLLLDCSRGTKYEKIFDEIVISLEQKLSQEFNKKELALIIKVISRNLISAIVQILRDCKSEEEVENNIIYLVNYHINGLCALL